MTYREYMEIVKDTARCDIGGKEINDMKFRDELGIDSILLIGLILEIEKRTNNEVSFEKLQNVNVDTPADLWNVLEMEGEGLV